MYTGLFVEFGRDCERDVARAEEERSEHIKMRRSGESAVVGFTLFFSAPEAGKRFCPALHLGEGPDRDGKGSKGKGEGENGIIYRLRAEAERIKTGLWRSILPFSR
jgi:hypothetical protein